MHTQYITVCPSKLLTVPNWLYIVPNVKNFNTSAENVGNHDSIFEYMLKETENQQANMTNNKPFLSGLGPNSTPKKIDQQQNNYYNITIRNENQSNEIAKKFFTDEEQACF